MLQLSFRAPLLHLYDYLRLPRQFFLGMYIDSVGCDPAAHLSAAVTSLVQLK